MTKHSDLPKIDKNLMNINDSINLLARGDATAAVKMTVPLTQYQAQCLHDIATRHGIPPTAVIHLAIIYYLIDHAGDRPGLPF